MIVYTIELACNCHQINNRYKTDLLNILQYASPLQERDTS